VEAMQERGHKNAYKLDLLADKIPGDQDMILADAVLLHFSDEQTKRILVNCHAALKPDGILVASIKRGKGEEKVKDKLGLPRFFHYWSPEEFKQLLKESGYTVVYESQDSTGRNNSEWFSVIAKPIKNRELLNHPLTLCPTMPDAQSHAAIFHQSAVRVNRS
jgi:hypothetical protein